MAETLSDSTAGSADANWQATATGRLAAIGLLAAGIAHELRNPLGVIANSTYLLRRQLDSENGRVALLQRIEDETRRASDLIQDFLDLAAGRLREPQPVQVADLLEQCRERLTAGTHIRLELDPAPPVRGRPRLLEQVFLNLAQNAAESMDYAGRLVVRLSVEGSWLTVRFEDQGPGVPAELLPRLFDPLATSKPGGTGLGLAISRHILQAHGGQLTYEGRPGQGAVFVAHLPVDSPAPKPLSGRHPTPSADLGPTRRLGIGR